MVEELAPAPGTPEQQTVPSASNEGEDQAKLILEYEKAANIPTPLEKWYRAFEADRRYVNNDCMALDAQDAVGTNHILRNTWTLVSMLNSRNADFRVDIEDMMWEPEPQFATDPRTGLPQLDMMGQPMVIGELPGQPPPEYLKFARTCEVLGKRLLKETRFRQQLNGAIQDVETNALMFVKVNQQQDLKRDPIGNLRFNDQQDNFALYRHMAAKIASKDILEGSADMEKFKQLEQTVRMYQAAMIRQSMADNPVQPQPVIDPVTRAPMVDELGAPLLQPVEDPREAQAEALEAGTGPVDTSQVPEVASWIGLPVDFVQPEDIRFDWDITRPEDFWRSKRVQHRVFMDRDECAAKYGLTPDEAKKLQVVGGTSTTSASQKGDPTNRDETLTQNQPGAQVEVWECWDKVLNRVNVWVKGLNRFLQSYTPTVVWRMWFPFVPFLFNRTTGRFVGVSSVTLQRPAQEEINQNRTLDRHAKKACFPKILVRKGVFQRGEARKYKNALPYEVIELDLPDEINSAIKETATATYNPQLTDTSRAEMDLQRMAGVSLVTGGAVGVSNSATETATAQAGTDAMTDFRRGIIEDLHVDVLTCMLDMAITLLPEANVKALAGPGAFWPVGIDRQTLWRSMSICVRSGSTGRPDADKTQEQLIAMSQFATGLGLQAKGPELIDEMGREMGRYSGFGRFFQLMPMAPAGPGGPPGAGGPKGREGGPPNSPPAPGSRQGEGGGGGAPMSGPPKPESIPNRPQI